MLHALRRLAPMVCAFGLFGAPAQAEVGPREGGPGSSARWHLGVIELLVLARVADSCLRFVRAQPQGVTARTLRVQVSFDRPPGARCETRPTDIERAYNFPSIARTTTAIDLRFVLDGRERGRETVEIGARP